MPIAQRARNRPRGGRLPAPAPRPGVVNPSGRRRRGAGAGRLGGLVAWRRLAGLPACPLGGSPGRPPGPPVASANRVSPTKRWRARDNANCAPVCRNRRGPAAGATKWAEARAGRARPPTAVAHCGAGRRLRALISILRAIRELPISAPALSRRPIGRRTRTGAAPNAYHFRMAGA